MDYTFRWDIKSFQVAPSFAGLLEVIKRVEWDYVCSDGTDTFALFGYTDLAAPSSETFVSYNAITRNDVISWLLEHLNEDGLKAASSNALEEVKVPKNETRTPIF